MGVRLYSGVRYARVYPGVDVEYHSDHGRLKSEYRVSPGADPSAIRLHYAGRGVTLRIDSDGSLIVATRDGVLREPPPVLFQLRDADRLPVLGSWRILDANTAGFEISDYDHTRPLVIDPTLSYSTYLGGSGTDVARAIAVDASNNIYVAGYTDSTDFPTPSATQVLSGRTDAFVVKLNSTGSAVMYWAYIGGAGDDRALSIAVAADGIAYVGGWTRSTNFPRVGGVQTLLAGGQDGFVLKLDAAGSSLGYSTFLGGADDDSVNSIAVDSSGNVYAAGQTLSATFPVALAYQGAKAAGQDGFVLKMNAAGSALAYATFLGGTGDDRAAGIAVDSMGAAYVSGTTNSADFPILGAIQSTSGGGVDAFVSKFNAAGSGLVYSTYLGGSGTESTETGNPIAVDNENQAYIGGRTSSQNFPIAFAYQGAYGGGSGDGFLSKLNAAGSAFIYSSYFGASGDDSVAAVATDSIGDAFVVGSSSSTDFPLVGATQPSLGGRFDAFLSKFSATGAQLHESTLVGGSDSDAAYGLALDSTGNAYLAGRTLSGNFPLLNAVQGVIGGSVDAFLARFSFSQRSGVATAAGHSLEVFRATPAGTSDVDPPIATSVWPSSGFGTSQLFTLAYFNAGGYTDLRWVEMAIASTVTSVNSCYIHYDRAANLIYLANDAGSDWIGAVTPGTAATVESSQCRVNAAGSSSSGAGNSLTFAVSIAFKTYAGAKNIYMQALNNAGVPAGWGLKGTWTVPAKVNAATVTVCSSGCTTTSLQAALSSVAKCGDTIQIKSSESQTGNYTFSDRGCTADTPITVTTDRAAWLPTPGTRVSPSHLPNLATISSPNTAPALAGVLTAGSPARHWRFVGIAFNAANAGGFAYYIVNLKYYSAASLSELPDDITFDRCYFYTPLPNGGATGVNVQNGLYAETRSLVVRDSFFADIAWPGFESHTIAGVTVEGPWTITNNYIMTSSIPIFTGGAIPDYGGALAKNLTIKYNYIYRPWKWLDDPMSPYHADFLANNSYSPCRKNLGELKQVDGALWEFNVHENAWSYNACQGQQNGFTLTPRSTFTDSVSTSAMGTADIRDTSYLTWSGAWSPPQIQDAGVCAILPELGQECRPITTVDATSPRKRITVNPPFSRTAKNTRWFFVYDNSTRVRGLTIRNSVFQNVARAFANLGKTPGGGSDDQGLLKNTVIMNNLILNDHPYLADSTLLFYVASDLYGPVDGGTDYLFAHNTFYSAAPVSRLLQFASSDNPGEGVQPKVNRMVFRDNLLPPAQYPVLGDGTIGTQTTLGTYAKNTMLLNNTFPGMPDQTCLDTNICSGNKLGAYQNDYVSVERKIFRLQPSSPYAKAATDGRDIGVDVDELPLVYDISVKASAQSALLEFDLSKNNATIPCVLEVSTNRNLHSGLNIYSVVDDLNPAYFFQADSSGRTNVKLPPVVRSDRHIFWPIGQIGTVLDDTGTARSLALIPGTSYYGRLMCGGATGLFAFATPPLNVPPTGVSVSPQSGSGSAQIFTFEYYDGNGAADIRWVEMAIAPSVTSINSCYVHYDRLANTVQVARDDGTGWVGTRTLGVAGTLGNSQCIVDAAASSVTVSNLTMFVKLSITFRAAYAGTKNVYLQALDSSGLVAGWIQRGTFNATGMNEGPTSVSVTPSSGRGSTETFTFVSADVNGASDIRWVEMAIHNTLTSVASCYLHYDRLGNTLQLANDAGSGWVATSVLGTTGTLENSQCAINLSTAATRLLGNQISLVLPVIFKGSFAGARNIYMQAMDIAGLVAGWTVKGTYTVD